MREDDPTIKQVHQFKYASTKKDDERMKTGLKKRINNSKVKLSRLKAAIYQTNPNHLSLIFVLLGLSFKLNAYFGLKQEP